MLARDEEEVAGEQEEGGAPREPPEAYDRGVDAGFGSSPRALRAMVGAGKDGGGRTDGTDTCGNETFGLG